MNTRLSGVIPALDEAARIGVVLENLQAMRSNKGRRRYAGINRSATPLLHQRCLVGGGPSSNKCP